MINELGNGRKKGRSDGLGNTSVLYLTVAVLHAIGFAVLVGAI